MRAIVLVIVTLPFSAGAFAQSQTAARVICAPDTTNTVGCDVTVPTSGAQTLINSVIANCPSPGAAKSKPGGPGCKITLRDGTYAINASIVIDRSNIDLEGESKPYWGSYISGWSDDSPTGTIANANAKVIATSTGFSLIAEGNSNVPDNGENRHRNVRLANLYLVGDYSYPPYGDIGIYFPYGADVDLFESIFAHRLAKGIVTACDNCWIRGNNIQDVSSDPIHVTEGSGFARVEDNTMFDIGGTLYLGADNGAAVGNIIGNCGSADCVTIVGNGVSFVGNSIGAGQYGAVTISNGTSSGRGAVVVGNTFNETVGSEAAMTRAYGLVRVRPGFANAGANISSNTFIPHGTEGLGVYAIDLNDSTGNTVIGNNILGGFNGGSATTINCTACSSNTVELNRGDISWPSGKPTIASGFGGSAAVTHSAGPQSFSVNVGGGGVSSGVVGLPAAAHGWACQVNDVTTADSNETVQTTSSTVAVTFKNYARGTGATVNWPANDILQASCWPN